MALQSYVGDAVKGRVDINNSSSTAFVADAIWAYGTWDGTTFNIRMYSLWDNYSFPPGNTQLLSGVFATPNDSGTWSVAGILMDDFTSTSPKIYDMEVKANEWIIASIPISIPTGGIYIIPVL